MTGIPATGDHNKDCGTHRRNEGTDIDTPHSGNGPQGPRKGLEEQLREAASRVEEEVRRVVRYVDDEVVPEVRRNGSKALRIASERLRQLAEQMEDRHSATPPSPPPPGERPR